MRIDFVTLFPEMVLEALNHSMIRRAQERGLAVFGAASPRDFAYDGHRTVDDAPYGGGPGMVMKPEPVARALAWLLADCAKGMDPHSEGDRPRTNLTGGLRPEEKGLNGFAAAGAARPASDRAAVVLTDPIGKPFSQEAAKELAAYSQVVFLCGHYEGIDDRIRTLYATHVFSIGDFILTGGELPALVMADAVTRLIPEVLGSAESLGQDSHEDGLLSAPQFTRPEVFEGIAVPAELRSGNHKQAAAWKRKQALAWTRNHRPDLFCRAPMAKSDVNLLSF